MYVVSATHAGIGPIGTEVALEQIGSHLRPWLTMCGHRAMTWMVREKPMFSHQTSHPDAARNGCPVHGVPHAHVGCHTRSDWPAKPSSHSQQVGHPLGCADSSVASASCSIHSPIRRASRHPQTDWILSPMFIDELISHSWFCERMARAFFKMSRSFCLLSNSRLSRRSSSRLRGLMPTAWEGFRTVFSQILAPLMD